MSGGDTAIAYAEAQIGKWYSTFPDGVNTFDCSLLVQKAWESAGVNIPRTTFQQVFAGTAVDQSGLLPGDLIFPEIGHVQLYVGNGQIIEAATTGTQVRKVAMWGGVWKARRVGEAGSGSSSLGNGPAGSPILNPVDPKTWPVIKELGGIAASLMNSRFWIRGGEIGLGLLLIVLAVVFINRRRVGEAVKTGTKAAEIGAVL